MEPIKSTKRKRMDNDENNRPFKKLKIIREIDDEFEERYYYIQNFFQNQLEDEMSVSSIKTEFYYSSEDDNYSVESSTT